MSRMFCSGRPNNSESSTFEAALVREINPQDFLYRDSIPFTSDENEGSFACGHCGVKFVSEAPRLGMSGKERIMMHMEYVHTSVKRGDHTFIFLTVFVKIENGLK